MTSAAVVRGTSIEIPGTLRACAVGAAVGSVLAMCGVGGGLWLSTHSVTVAIGVGAMAAFWGGLGFGAMLGGTIHLIRHTDDVGNHLDPSSRSAVPSPSPLEPQGGGATPPVAARGGVRDVSASSGS
jgi:hypothetical protein